MYKEVVAYWILATLLTCPTLVSAFGLGEIEIHSSLNQPMNAEIELVGFKADEIDEVKVELASQQMFERVGVLRPYILTQLKFTPALSAGKPVIKVTSTDSIHEPLLTCLISVRWAKGESGVSVNQIMLAIQVADPQSSNQRNINNLKSGVVLRIPPQGASNYSTREALADVQRQWQAWKQGSLIAESTDSAVAVNVDSGEMVDSPANSLPTAEQQSESATSSSKLSILSDDEVADGASGGDAKATLENLRKQVNLLIKNSESKGKENFELKNRIQSLESMLKKQENIISLQNEQLAQLQNTLTTDAEGVVAETLVERGMVADTKALVTPEEEMSELAAEADAQLVASIAKATVEPLPEEFLNVGEALEPQQPENLVAEAEVSVDQVAEDAPVIEEASLLTSTMDKIEVVIQDQGKTLLYAGGGLLALLLAWFGIKRRNSSSEDAIVASGLPAFADEPSIDDMLNELEETSTTILDSELDFNSDVATQAFGENKSRVDEDTVSLEQVQQNLAADLETLSFDGEDIDPDKIEEESLPILQTAEIGKPDLGGIDDPDENLAASETGTFEADMLAGNVTEQFDVGNIDLTMTDFGELEDDDELENPLVIEEVGTKLDLVKAFVDMGDEDAAKETLTEVIEQGDEAQIQEARDLLNKLD